MTLKIAARSGDTPPDPHTPREPSVATRLIRIVLVMGGIAGVIVAAVAIALPSKSHGSTPPAQTSLAAERAGAQRAAENEKWASATCANILAWKNEIEKDQAGMLSLKALTRVNDAITATKRMLAKEDKLGLPPGAQTAQPRAEANRLRIEIDSRIHNIEKAANEIEGGNISAIGTLAAELQNAKTLVPQVTNELRHMLSVDLGLSLAGANECRQLVGIPI